VYVAMLSRGYEGTVRLLEGSRFGAVDAVFLGGLLLAVVSIRALSAL